MAVFAVAAGAQQKQRVKSCLSSFAVTDHSYPFHLIAVLSGLQQLVVSDAIAYSCRRTSSIAEKSYGLPDSSLNSCQADRLGSQSQGLEA